MATYYFIGIKGSGMSALANILLDQGHRVLGSDIDQHIFTQDKLEMRGVEIFSYHPDNIKDDYIVVVGNSFDKSHVEVEKAKALNLETYKYVEMLALLIDQSYSVGIAGTHGKTTTTGLVSTILKGQGKTGFLIGDGHGLLESDAINFVVECCEYQDNYLNYYPNIVLINNIELDHVDYFKSMEQYIQSFINFASHAKDYVVLNGDDVNVQLIPRQDNYYYFGLNENNDFVAKNVSYHEKGITFDLYTRYQHSTLTYAYTFNLNFYGAHMLMNALAAITIYVLRSKDLDYEKMATYLNDYQGVARRFDIIEVNDNVFIDDYAHHPTAINLMIETVRQKYPDKKLISIFKPDRYSRIYEFGKEIALALNKSDEAYLFEFPSTSVKEEGIDIDMNYVLKDMKQGEIIAEDQSSIDRFKNYHNCVFLFMSSKNVYDYREALIQSLE